MSDNLNQIEDSKLRTMVGLLSETLALQALAQTVKQAGYLRTDDPEASMQVDQYLVQFNTIRRGLIALINVRLRELGGDETVEMDDDE